MKISLIPQPHILLAASDGHLLLQLATLLADTRADFTLAHTPEEFTTAATNNHYNLIITTFAHHLLGTNTLATQMRSQGLSAPLFVLLNEPNEEVAADLTIGLLCGGASEVFALPVSCRRLHRHTRTALAKQTTLTPSNSAQNLTYL